MVPVPQLAALEAQVPARVLDELRALVQAGWFGSLDEVVADALRRFLSSHRDDLLKAMVQEDVEWGLRGRD